MSLSYLLRGDGGLLQNFMVQALLINKPVHATEITISFEIEEGVLFMRQTKKTIVQAILLIVTAFLIILLCRSYKVTTDDIREVILLIISVIGLISNSKKPS